MKKANILELKEVSIKDSDKLAIVPYHQGDAESHRHHFFELVYITAGSAVHTLNDTGTSLKPGDYFILDYDSLHSYSKSKNFAIINCLFLPEIVEDTLKDCRSFEVLMQRCLLRYYRFYSGETLSNRTFHDEDGSILRLLEGMLREYQERQIGYTEVFRLRLMEILILTMRKIMGTHIDSLSDFSLEVIQYINQHYQSKQILNGYCREHHFTPQYVSRRFKQDTGMTVMNYLQKVRIEKSCELLAGSSRSISEIAQEVGYGDTKFFNQMFRRTLQISPGEYRKKIIKKQLDIPN